MSAARGAPRQPPPGHGGQALGTDHRLRSRRELLCAVRELDASGLNRGSSGNASLRCAQAGRSGMLITPTGFGAAALRARDLVWVGDDGAVAGAWQPSSEWRFHQAVYRRRSDLGAVVHAHAENAAALSCLGRGLPPFHYMVAIAGGDSVPCTPYHLFGSDALAQAVADALAGRDACLIAHHGLVAAGATLAQALRVAVEVEWLCALYLKLLPLGEPPRLSAAQMDAVRAQFRGYGRARRS